MSEVFKECDEESNKKHKRSKKIILICIVILLITVLIIISCLNYNEGYKKPINNHFKAIEKADTKMFLEDVPEFIYKNGYTVNDDYMKKQLEIMEFRLRKKY